MSTSITDTPLTALTAYPAGGSAWVHERGLGPVLMRWVNPEHSDGHEPIDPGLWAALVEQLPGLSGSYLPFVLTVAHEDDERLVPVEAATPEDLQGALTTALVTACRLHDELTLELRTAAAVLEALQGVAG